MPSSSIAIIDDDEIFQMLIKKIIEKNLDGNVLMQFRDGYSALSYIKNINGNIAQLPSIIFLDLSMPGMDGWQFLTQLGLLQFESIYKPSVFIISGNSNPDFEQLKKYSLIKGYLIKPVAPAELIDIVRRESDK